MQTLKAALSGKKVGESRDMVKLLRIQATETHLVEFDNVDTRFNDCTNWQVVKGGERILFSTRMHERFSEVKSGVLATITVCENAVSGVLASVRNSEQPDGRELQLADSVRKESAVPDKSLSEESRASRVVADLARAEQDMVRQTGDSGRGRMPEIEEQTLTRTIQKER